MELIIIVVSIVFALLCIFEVASLLTYGWYINKSVRDKIMSRIDDYTHLNTYDENILSSRKGIRFIAVLNLQGFSRYHVDDIGLVPRFTKLSYAIGKKFKELKATESTKSKAIKSFEND